MVFEVKKYSFTRDLVGYGQEGRNAEWPGGARIAVSMCVNYEEGAESSVLNGDMQAETALWEKAGGQPFVNAAQPNVESDYDYGARSGIWRILRLFAEHSFPFTLLAVGKAVEKNPSVAKACVAAGHEIAGHGYRWLDARDFTPEEEKEGVKSAIRAIQDAAGTVPQGWYVGRLSPNSVGVVWEAFQEMGLPLKWQSDFYGDDVPTWVDLPPALVAAQKTRIGPEIDKEAGGLLHVPYSYECNDMKFHLAADGFGGASFYDHLVNAFDMLYEEGGKMMSIGLHARIVGKPGRARQFQRFLDYISQKPDVWVCTRAEIASHWRDKFPYQPPTKRAQ